MLYIKKNNKIYIYIKLHILKQAVLLSSFWLFVLNSGPQGYAQYCLTILDFINISKGSALKLEKNHNRLAYKKPV